LGNVYGDVDNPSVHSSLEIAAVVHVGQGGNVDVDWFFLEEKSDAVVHLLTADVDVVAELMELRRKLALSALELLEAETGGTLVENEMEEMGQTSADGVDIPRQNSVVVLVWGANTAALGLQLCSMKRVMLPYS
jgi:hypothetical protein